MINNASGASADGMDTEPSPEPPPDPALDNSPSVEATPDDNLAMMMQLETTRTEQCQTGHIRRVYSMVRKPNHDLGCCGVLKQIFFPVKSISTKYGDGDGITEIVVCPEAFRMLFYVYFIIFLLMAVLVTSLWGETDLEDNPILHRFGTNNLCMCSNSN